LFWKVDLFQLFYFDKKKQIEEGYLKWIFSSI